MLYKVAQINDLEIANDFSSYNPEEEEGDSNFHYPTPSELALTRFQENVDEVTLVSSLIIARHVFVTCEF